MQDGRIQVVHVYWILHDLIAEVTGFAIAHARGHATPGQPDSEAARMVIAPIVVLGQFALAVGGASEFATPDDQGLIKQPSLFQIENQCGS